MAPSDANAAHLRLIERFLRLPDDRLGEVEHFLNALSTPGPDREGAFTPTPAHSQSR
jgi:hypothetical protein